MELSVMDKTAVMKRIKGNIIQIHYQRLIVPLNEDVKNTSNVKFTLMYRTPFMFTSMILTRKQPQVTEKIGAEFPFTRYFYGQRNRKRLMNYYTVYGN